MKSFFRAKNLVFGLVAFMTAYVLYHNERFLINSSDPVWQHYQPFKWWLLPHGIAGTCALLLAPLQFSDRLRQRYIRLHRVVGRIYVFGALILAPLGAYIQLFNEGGGAPRSFTVLAVVDAVLLMSTTAIAFAFALKGRIRQHREWMTRSYAVALVFFEGRVISGLTGLDNDVVLSQAIIWSCMAFALLFADVANHWSDIRAAAVGRTDRSAVAVRVTSDVTAD
jgi:uncharacterized membrane protein